MIAEIITVGTEILMGQILNTNAKYISERLSDLGVSMYYQTTVGDNPKRLKETFLCAWQRSDVVLLTGGLGPTMDDLTKETVAEALGLPMEMNEQARAGLEEFYSKISTRKMTPNNLKQAVFPVGCAILDNPNGTAPGCRVEKDGKMAFILPGPPREMQPMFDNLIAPYLREKSGCTIHSKVLRIFGMGESTLEHNLRQLIETQTNPTLATYAGFGEVTLRISAQSDSVAEANRLIEEMEQKVRAIVGPYVYGEGNVSIDGVAAGLLMRQNKRLGIAESCTGGQVVSGLVDYPGISSVLMEGVVCYSNRSKLERLGVSEEILDTCGAVSEQCALAMCDGLLRQGNCDIALSTTGIAGPDGGSADKPVGTVYIALVGEGVRFVKRFKFGGERERVRRWATLNAYNLLRLHLLGVDLQQHFAK